ncbi:M28 family metallopeptidase [Haloferula helveola]|uniref:M28 family metallopeptidase n=1 Tax=Haloferula helveola TaxID=490095 RepID=UPI0030D371A6
MAEDFVARRLAEIGCQPYRGDSFALPYRRHDTDFTNFVGVVPGTDRTLPPLLIGAHYDSVIAAPCADDNGAAVAICLALGKRAADLGGFKRDLVVAIFDAEEPPYFQSDAMGSNRFHEDQLDDRGVHLAIIYDLVGHDIRIPGVRMAVPGLAGLTFVTGCESHPELPDLVGSVELPDKFKLVATLNRYVGDMSDHGAFRKSGTPYLFFSCGRWEHYHEPTDTPDRLNYRKMARLTELSAGVLERADNAGLDESSEAADPASFEARTFRRSLGVAYPLFCKWAGVSEIDDRDSLDRVAGKLLGLGL